MARVEANRSRIACSEAARLFPLTQAGVIHPVIGAHLGAATAAAFLLRPLDRLDLLQVETHLLALDSVDRRARFGTASSDTTIATYARRIDPADAVLFGAVDHASGRIIGLAEAQPVPSAPARVEMAVSVHRPHRRRGLGRRLVAATLATAFERGAEVAEFFFDPGNRPIITLVLAFDARIDATGAWAEIRRADALARSRPA